MEKGTIKKIAAVFFLILILGIGGFFLWNKNQNTTTEKWMEAKMSTSEDFIAKDTSDGRLIENKEAGITYRIPAEWVLDEGYSSFYSPDANFNENRGDVVAQGCKINIDISFIKTNIETLENFQKENVSQLSSVIKNLEFKRAEFKNFPALFYGFDVESLKMSYSWIEIPFKNRLYSILLTCPIEQEDKCNIELNEFLESVVISDR